MSSQHYFTAQPESKTDEREITASLRGKSYRFVTDAGVFSKGHVDEGTRLLIETVEFPASGLICDLGCGYGPIGLVAADQSPACMVHLVDVNARAVALAERNLELNNVTNAEVFLGDGFAPLPAGNYHLILTNPPIRAGKKVVYPLVEEAYQRLEPGGRLCLVIRTKQGAKSMEKHMASLLSKTGRADRSALCEFAAECAVEPA